ncbi:MAG: exodeoxyribonuclease VII small subunit [Bacillota bacterium]
MASAKKTVRESTATDVAATVSQSTALQPSLQEPEEELSFAKALKLLEETVKSLESGELSLEDSLAKFEEGIRLARRLEAVLDRAEQRVKEILNPAEPEK